MQTNTFCIWFYEFVSRFRTYSFSFLILFILAEMVQAAHTNSKQNQVQVSLLVSIIHSLFLFLLGLHLLTTLQPRKKTIIINSQRSFSSFFRFNFYLFRFRAFHFGFFVISVCSVLRRFCRFSLCDMNRSGWYISHSTAFDAVVDISLFVQ